MGSKVLIPTSFDAVRLDVLTISGLLASLYSLLTARNESTVLIASGTIVQYILRVLFNVSNMLQRYTVQQSRQQLRSLLARDFGSVLVLRDLVIQVEVTAGLLVLGGLATPPCRDGLPMENLVSTLEELLKGSCEDTVDLSRVVPRVVDILERYDFIQARDGVISLTTKGRESLQE